MSVIYYLLLLYHIVLLNKKTRSNQDGGDKGGLIVGKGTPEDICKIKNSLTGKHLKKLL